MRLSDLIHSRIGVGATANPATAATEGACSDETVAGLATVAVASPAADAASSAWVVHFADGLHEEVWYAPAATRAEVLAMNLDALAAEPQQPRAWRVAGAAEAEELRALVDAIYAADSEADRIEAQRIALLDAEAALRCYRAIMRERWGDLRACSWCSNLHNRSCVVAKPGGMVDARRGYQPEPYRARRCPGYLPPRFDPDQRTASQRWPGLTYILETDT